MNGKMNIGSTGKEEGPKGYSGTAQEIHVLIRTLYRGPMDMSQHVPDESSKLPFLAVPRRCPQRGICGEAKV